MMPELLLINSAGWSTKKFPGGRATIPLIPKPACHYCGAKQGDFQGNGTLRLQGGKSWPDVMQVLGTNGPHFVLSERAKVALERIGCNGIRWFSTEIAAVDGGPTKQVPPRYFWFAVDGRIDVDLSKSPYMCREKRCPICDTRLEGPFPPQSLVPIHQTWDGSDFFKIRNYKTNDIGCSPRVLQIARDEGWTNCKFYPFDVLRRHTREWDGIDYLGKQWPPKSWYPVPKSSRRNYDEWLTWLGTNIHPAAHEPLLDFCPRLIDRLRELIRSGTELQRWNALWAMRFAYHDGYCLDSSELDAVAAIENTPAPLAALRDRLLHGDEGERNTAAHALFNLHKERRIDLLPDEKEAVFQVLPHLPQTALD